MEHVGVCSLLRVRRQLAQYPVATSKGGELLVLEAELAAPAVLVATAVLVPQHAELHRRHIDGVLLGPGRASTHLLHRAVAGLVCPGKAQGREVRCIERRLCHVVLLASASNTPVAAGACGSSSHNLLHQRRNHLRAVVGRPPTGANDALQVANAVQRSPAAGHERAHGANAEAAHHVSRRAAVVPGVLRVGDARPAAAHEAAAVRHREPLLLLLHGNRHGPDAPSRAAKHGVAAGADALHARDRESHALGGTGIEGPAGEPAAHHALQLLLD
mmetsp:Transcript_7338/g.18824  ORF Transcript_7338/g.18824 Transcript_7338/m.18824 type:complete len:273 (+) Transcript_7338:1093-1911(+)